MRKKIVIIGSGISGLSAAWFLQKRFSNDVDITIFEKNSYPGGWVQTREKGDFLFELGPRFFKGSKCKSLLDLIEDLDLKDKMILSSSQSKKRLVLMNDRLEPLPTNLISFFSSPLTKGLFWSFLKEIFRPKSTKDDETIRDFLQRRFASEKLEFLFDCFTTGIHAGSIDYLSMKVCFPEIWNWEKKYGSVTKGILSQVKNSIKPSSLYSKLSFMGLFSLEKGIHSLITTLEEKINADIQFNQEVKKITSKENAYLIETNQHKMDADAIIIATPVKKAHQILEPLKIKGVDYLGKMQSVSIGTVGLGFERKIIKDPSVGYLVPSSLVDKIKGCTFESFIYPSSKTDATKISFFLGGHQFPELVNYTEDQCISLALEALKKHLKIDEKPIEIVPFLAPDAIPQFQLHHEKKIKDVQIHLKEAHRNIHLAGNYFQGAGINNCIERSKEVVEECASSLRGCM